jgi:hypothetical protein
MNILLTGASGFIGSALVPFLEAGGHRVIRLSRAATPVAGPHAFWNPAAGRIDLADAGALDAVVHLAGEPVAQRWTAAAKARIRASRVQGTRLLSEALARLPTPPRVLVAASAIGFYGDRGSQPLDEGSPAGEGFLAGVCREWEAATEPTSARGVRVVQLRLGLVLAREGGALAALLPVFRLGLGGSLGSGGQYWSWIALEDVLSAVERALTHDDLSGPVNAVAPQAVTNREFTRALAGVLGRPAVCRVPAFAVKLLFGEMGREGLLASARVQPAKLAASGFAFRFPELEGALRHALGLRPRP